MGYSRIILIINIAQIETFHLLTLIGPDRNIKRSHKNRCLTDCLFDLMAKIGY